MDYDYIHDATSHCSCLVVERVYTNFSDNARTFHMDYLFENGTTVPIFFHCESPLTYIRNHLQNMSAAFGDMKLYHVECSSKLTQK